MNLIQKEYYELWVENQIFESMLAEIGYNEEGHYLLKDLFSKHIKKYQ